jgi:glycosyltransferase involved in cell wall biosynthesis
MNQSVAYVSTYPPKQCGIATFTRDLARAVSIRDPKTKATIVAIHEEHNPPDANIRFAIDKHDRASYISAAAFLNEADVDVVCLQHEYGIFGGEYGEYILDLCRNLKKPMVTTFHTVLRNPPEKAREILTEIAQLSNTVVVTLDSAARLLENLYEVAPEKIRIIGHGARLSGRVTKEHAKKKFGFQHRPVLATFGLISQAKGIEYAIKSLTPLVIKRPDLLYLVIGETHPEVRKREGEAYREYLIKLTKQRKLEQNVRFIDRYLRDDEISSYLQAVDVYVAPYTGKDQVSSGTITEALAHGKAIIATPTTFAKEILADNRGLFCKFSDTRSLAKCVRRILDNPRLRRQLEQNAFNYGLRISWTITAEKFAEVFRLAAAEGIAAHSQSPKLDHLFAIP